MSPEYGATAGFFPVDRQTLNYLRETGRPPALIDLVERYTGEQGLFRADDAADPEYTGTLELDLGDVEPSLAGPRRPQDRIPLAKAASIDLIRDFDKKELPEGVSVNLNGREVRLDHGSVVIAAITGCTNTSNPSVMVGAGLLAKNAVRLGLQVPPHVKTSFAPGSRVVSRYLEAAGLTPYLEALGFHLVGYGCTTCIGNSGPLHPISAEITEGYQHSIDAIFKARLRGDSRSKHDISNHSLTLSFKLIVGLTVLCSKWSINCSSRQRQRLRPSCFIKRVSPGKKSFCMTNKCLD